jgi:allantoin racemase
MRIKFIIPFPLDEEGVRLRASQLSSELIPPGVEVVWSPVKNSGTGGDSQYDTFLMDIFCFEEGLKAEEEGFDAVCIDTVTDSGMVGLRSRLSIPVVGPGTVCFHLACTLGSKFSIVTTWKKWYHFYYKSITDMQLWPKVASIRAAGVEPDVSKLISEEKQKKTFEAYEKTALQCIEEDGANVIVLGSTTMHQAYAYLKERLPCPVINPGIWAFKIAVMLVELGVSHSKVCYPSPPQPQDDMIFSRLAKAKQ